MLVCIKILLLHSNLCMLSFRGSCSMFSKLCGNLNKFNKDLRILSKFNVCLSVCSYEVNIAKAAAVRYWKQIGFHFMSMLTPNLRFHMKLNILSRITSIEKSCLGQFFYYYLLRVNFYALGLSSCTAIFHVVYYTLLAFLCVTMSIYD